MPSPTPSEARAAIEQVKAIIGELHTASETSHAMGYEPRAEHFGQQAAAFSTLLSVLEAQGKALKSAGAQFRFYELQHAAKGTPDADAKARINAEMAEQMEALALSLTETEGGPHD